MNTLFENNTTTVYYNYKYDVFISYTSPDLTKAEELANKLKNDGFSVFFAEWEILAGNNILIKCEEALKSSYKLIFLTSKSSDESEWLKFEKSMMRSTDLIGSRRKIIPILIEECNIPSSQMIYKYLDFTSGITKDNYNLLLRALKDIKSMQIGPFELISESSLPHILDHITNKVNLYFDYPKKRISLLKQAYYELTKNAFEWGTKYKDNIMIKIIVYEDHIRVEVVDFGDGFDLQQQINLAREPKPKNKISLRKKGLLSVYNNCDGLFNKKTDKDHSVIAIVKKDAPLKIIPNFKPLQIDESTHDYYMQEDPKIGILFLTVMTPEIKSGISFPSIQQILNKFTKYRNYKIFILDLTNVEFITSGGWGDIFSSEIWKVKFDLKGIIMSPFSYVEEDFYKADWNLLTSDLSIKVFNNIEDALASLYN